MLAYLMSRQVDSNIIRWATSPELIINILFKIIIIIIIVIILIREVGNNIIEWMTSPKLRASSLWPIGCRSSQSTSPFL